ncbi:class I mannose-6-phosphate isomerase [Clostridium sp. MB40-C1]|uniref:type I phosphomannose isomerase catalytic subunit n=1 Tax=Clostridium sp. MB40-C1 TaxID=3070996 RepID=UPI0027E061B4|nr:type I phosphomannose isomerase catalytic subunit [Clostridium sp. MB40-C1]WMJ79225.1 class I mannose-6-phosphate isomerase [Clostridium sp. MB40-C1]
MKKYIYKLSPFFKETIWGWEKWVLSCHENGHSFIENGEESGKKIINVIENKNKFPILVKVIKADSVLSVQVHPDDIYAQRYENSSGKTECWYILEAKENASLILGIKKGLNKNELYKIVKEGNLENYLQEINVSSGDFIYIPSGTIHSIKGGIKLIEVQQNSDITYRLYDWGRGRKEHLNKALDVIDYEGKNKGGKIDNFKVIETPYFKIKKIDIKNEYKDFSRYKFHSYVVVQGSGIIECEENVVELNCEDAVYIPKEISYVIKGKMTLLKIIT